VLLAEDDSSTRHLVAAQLRAAGHQVTEASDGLEVVDRLEDSIWSERHDRFDILISDVQMPGLSGLDVMLALRCANMPTPVVLLTAFGDRAIIKEAFSLGASAVLIKPIDPFALETAIATATGANGA
jgi:CheY-like chemotaxis protein